MHKGKTTGKTFAAFLNAMIDLGESYSKAQGENDGAGYAGIAANLPLAFAEGVTLNAILTAEFDTTQEAVIAATRKLADADKLVVRPIYSRKLGRSIGVRLLNPSNVPETTRKAATPDVLASVAKLIG